MAGAASDRRVAGRAARSRGSRTLAKKLAGALMASTLLTCVQSADASGLLAPAAGAADIAVSGSNIAEPLSASGAQFVNPAGLAAFTEPAVFGGPGIGLARGEVKADFPEGYDKSNDMVIFIPDFGVVYPVGRWTIGWSAHGSSGSRYDYGAEPSLGIIDGFFSENSIFAMPLGAAYRVSDRLWVGAEIIPLYSMTEVGYTSPWVPELETGPVPFHFKVSGPGLQASFGVTWKPDDRWAFGLSYRPPGRIWTDGGMRLAAGTKQDVQLDIEAPSVVAFGISRKLGEHLTLSYGFRWTDSSAFGHSYFRFEETPSADASYIQDAGDEWRHAVGAEFALTQRWVLRGGAGHGTSIVGNKGVNPASYDVEDVSLTCGAGYTLERWRIDGAFMYLFGAERNVPADDALVFPGSFKADPAVMFALTVTRRF